MTTTITPEALERAVELALTAIRAEEKHILGEYKTPDNGARRRTIKAGIFAALPELLAAQPASSAGGQPVGHSVLQVGGRGAAYDPPNSHRAFTYNDQPSNEIAWRLGEAARHAKPGGDLIDHGISLLDQLQQRGFGVFQIGTLAAPVAGEAAQQDVGNCGVLERVAAKIRLLVESERGHHRKSVENALLQVLPVLQSALAAPSAPAAVPVDGIACIANIQAFARAYKVEVPRAELTVHGIAAGLMACALPAAQGVDLEPLLRLWEERSRGALPADAMLINKHVRELREALSASQQHQQKESGDV